MKDKLAGQSKEVSPSASPNPESERGWGSVVSIFNHATDWIRLVSAFGIPLYVFLWAAANAFYSRLGVEPAEVGLGYGSILIKSWGQLLILGSVAAVYLVVIRYRPGWVRPAAVVLLVAFLAWWVSLLVLSVSRSTDVRQGTLHTSTLLFVPVMPWSVWPATAAPAVESPPSKLMEITSHCIVYLGKAEGTTVLYDADLDTSLRVPSGQLILSVQSRGQRPECP
jgi:hypothetical protein